MKELKPCGTEAAYRRHVRHNEPIDEACDTAHRAYRSNWERERRAGLRPRRRLKPCGTRAAYDRHKRRGERACFPCRLANAQRKHNPDQTRKVS